MKKQLYWIWSNEHSAWWKANHNGYVVDHRGAGVYEYEEALKICIGANIGFYNGHEKMPFEVMVPIRDTK